MTVLKTERILLISLKGMWRNALWAVGLSRHQWNHYVVIKRKNSILARDNYFFSFLELSDFLSSVAPTILHNKKCHCVEHCTFETICFFTGSERSNLVIDDSKNVT